ncbi:MAG: phosphotransferase family protein [Acidimicrobiales bacterium]
MTVADPRDAGSAATRLALLAGERFGGPVTVTGAPTPIGAGFDSYIHLVQLAGPILPGAWTEPLVLRLLPSSDRHGQALREAAVQGWCAAAGYPAPEVLAVFGPDDGFGLPAQVMERAPGTTALDALKAKPWRAFALVDQLARLQLQLHALPTDGWPGTADATALADQRLGLPRRVAERTGSPELQDALARVEAVIPIAVDDPHPVVCHGDFHPLNVMVDGPTGMVIDWTDAGLGPREADLARTLLLFHVAALAAGSAVERVVLQRVGPRLARRHRRTYEAGATLDPRRLMAWEAMHALHGWSQVVMLHAGGFEGSSSAEAADVPLALAGYLHIRLEQALAALT